MTALLIFAGIVAAFVLGGLCVAGAILAAVRQSIGRGLGW